MEELHVLAPALAVAAHLELQAGRAARALEHLEEFASVTRDVAPEYRESQLAAVVRDCLAAGGRELAGTLTAESSGAVRMHALNVAAANAAISEADGRTAEAATAYAKAAEAWRDFGDAPEELEALRGLARCDPSAADARTGEIAARLGIDAR